MIKENDRTRKGERVMHTDHRNRINRIGLMLLGAAVLANGAVATMRANMHAGIWFTYALGGILLLWGLLRPWLPRWIRVMLTAALTAAAVWGLALYGYGAVDTVDYREDAVVVLGTGIRGSELSDGLRNRLDRAVEYHAKNPNAVIAVSGGQGPQEDIPEGIAMERYLLEQGIPPGQIIRETVSSSTAENFRMTLPLLDAHFAADYRIAVISSDFHLFRAGLIAADCGFPDVTHAHAPTPWYMIIPNGLRECAALVKYWLKL